MKVGLNIAIIGATGAVGEAMIAVLQARKFKVKHFYPVASARSVGKTVDFNHQTYDVLDIATFDFSKVDIALFSAGGSVSAQYAPIAAAAGCIVIDNTSFFRMDPDVPLVVPEVNPEKIANYHAKNIIANPNCSTIQMVVALKPIYDAVGIKKINVATYQAVSGSGRKAIHELIHQCGELLNGRPVTPQVYSQQIAFNALPHIDDFQDNGYTREEMKMVNETRKIFADNELAINPTAVRVPVLYGHSEAIHLELKKEISVERVKDLLKKSPGIKVCDDINKAQYPTAISHAVGKDDVYVGRIRTDVSNKLGLNLWVVADNVRKGAATNAVQIAELVQEKYF